MEEQQSDLHRIAAHESNGALKPYRTLLRMSIISVVVLLIAVTATTTFLAFKISEESTSQAKLNHDALFCILDLMYQPLDTEIKLSEITDDTETVYLHSTRIPSPNSLIKVCGFNENQARDILTVEK